jgi:hypothetical protein
MRSIALVMLALMSTPAWCHQWYPALCCNGSDEGGDCHPVPCDELVENKSGIEWQGHQFRSDQIHVTLDRSCHVCVGHYHEPERDIPHCVFVQPNS